MSMTGVDVHSARIESVANMPALEVGWATHPGLDPGKQVNEDAVFARMTRAGHLAVVCDGMGGHVGGKEASNLAVETIFRIADDVAFAAKSPAEILVTAIREANRMVYQKGSNTPELHKMGSTCVAILTHANGTDVAHVGDSRAYLITQGQVYPITKDHSLVQKLVDANMLTAEEAIHHPNANQITNALGMKADIEVEVRPQPFPHTPGDTFLLCSDGLSDLCGPQDFLALLSPYPTCDVAAQQLVDVANQRGGHDNVSVMVVRVAGGGPFSLNAVGSTTNVFMQAPLQQTLEMNAAASPQDPAFVPTLPIATTSNQASVSSSNRNKSPILFLILIVVLIGGGIALAAMGGIAFYWSKRNAPSTSESSSVYGSENAEPTVKQQRRQLTPIATPTSEPSPLEAPTPVDTPTTSQPTNRKNPTHEKSPSDPTTEPTKKNSTDESTIKSQ